MKETPPQSPLALWLAATGWTATDLARQMSVTPAYISHILSGRRRPRQLLLRISEFTNIPYERLLRRAA